MLPLDHRPDALCLPPALGNPIGAARTWPEAAQAVAACLPDDVSAPSPGEVEGAVAIQTAVARRLSEAGEVSEPLAVEALAAVMARNPALPWLGALWGPTELPELPDSVRDAITEPLRAGSTLTEQLGFLARHWTRWLPDEAIVGITHALDVIAEESAVRDGAPGPTSAPLPGPGFDPGEGYTADRDWMPGLVLAVRHARVWLAQLGGWFDREVTRLDQIPDEALAAIAAQGATGLWLVGIWERSPASERIKRHRGNTEAAASAYSLVDTVVAADLGGERALDALSERAGRHGLRLCADVVPNHTGLDSRWVVEHPEWFLQVPEPPFPGYTFDGPDLSGDPRIEVRIEDGYWREDDAAVVFQRRDAATGEVRWLYHGNDGTSIPWNDTAQLDITLPEVRQALIETALAMTDRFGALRFDAAMALAKTHVRRLWYPGPGEGGGIPSRAGRGLSDEEWARRMPREFWVELVTAFQERAPDTLLLAEAFWTMEVDFVRRFGLNRVYWSAFRDWLRDGEHAKHKEWLAEVLARDPALIGHFCLFLSNPDEETCAQVFGTGDRFFAAATLQATFPGMVLLAHGQVNGLPERYGMEFTRPLTDGRPDADQIARHQREIEPLLRRRDLFGRAEGFRLFETPAPVYAFANRHDDDRALVVVNASDAPISARIERSVPTQVEDDVVRVSLAQALGLDGPLRLRDPRWELEVNVDGALDLELGPWETRAFLDVRQG